MSDAGKDPAAARAARSSGDVPDAVHDDDELAAALQSQLERFAPSGPIPIISPEQAEEDRLHRQGAAAGASAAPAAEAPDAPAAPDAPDARAASDAPPPPGAGSEGPVRPSWPSFAQADRPTGTQPAATTGSHSATA